MIPNSPRYIAFLVIAISIALSGCTHTEVLRWGVEEKTPEVDLVIIRRFNTGIREIDGVVPVSLPHPGDFALKPGQHKLLIQPEMWISTFPMEMAEQPPKILSISASAGQCIYLCLGISADLSWQPFAVAVLQGQNPRSTLLREMHAKNVGCFSYNKMIPVVWLTEGVR